MTEPAGRPDLRQTSSAASPLSTDRALGSLLAAAVVAALLTWGPAIGVPGMKLVGYPFRLLTTLAHELSHGLAAILTGGEFVRFVMFADGSGLALTTGGWRFLVIAAGYLGAAGFAAALIRLGAIPGARRWALGMVGVAAALLSLRYGWGSLWSEQWLGGLLTTVSGVLLGGACLAVALKAAQSTVVFAVHLIAFQAGLTSLADLATLIGLSRVGGTSCNIATDARSMAALTHLPAIAWAVAWALAAGAILAWALWGALRRWDRQP
jgi:hypothetical protein